MQPMPDADPHAASQRPVSARADTHAASQRPVSARADTPHVRARAARPVG
jgi:hypothetical protein